MLPRLLLLCSQLAASGAFQRAKPTELPSEEAASGRRWKCADTRGPITLRAEQALIRRAHDANNKFHFHWPLAAATGHLFCKNKLPAQTGGQTLRRPISGSYFSLPQPFGCHPVHFRLRSEAADAVTSGAATSAAG